MAMELARRGEVLPSRTDWQTMREMSDALHQSGLLPTWIKNPLAALAVIQKGSELGLTPMYSLSNIQMIEGKPTANAEAMAAMIYRDHGAGALNFIQTNERVCTIRYCRRGGEPKEFSFTWEEASNAQLTNKQNWQRYPKAMLRARCISAVARMAFPDCIGGLYTPEELDADVEVHEDGSMSIRDVTPERPAATHDRVRERAEARRVVEADGAVTKDNEPTDLENERAKKAVNAMQPAPAKPRRKRPETREEWIDALDKGFALATELGIDVATVDTSSLSDEEVSEVVLSLGQQIRAVEAALKEAQGPAENPDDFGVD